MSRYRQRKAPISVQRRYCGPHLTVYGVRSIERAGSGCLCSIVETELHFGVQNSSRPAENPHRIDLFYRTFDLMIASIAVAGSHALVTRSAG